MLLIFSKVLVVFIYIGVGLIANKLKVLPEESVKHFISGTYCDGGRNDFCIGQDIPVERPAGQKCSGVRHDRMQCGVHGTADRQRCFRRTGFLLV